MKTENLMQLKAKVKEKGQLCKIPPQAIMQAYLMECFLDRISRSKYKGNFILKGGMLISSIIGIRSRTTMDIDATIKGFPLNHEQISKVISEVCEVEADDDLKFELIRLESIREQDEYSGIRVTVHARYEILDAPLKIDITAGDKITPKEVNYEYQRLFDDPAILIKSYNIETVLAEKLETILSRSVFNTRPRDFYDVYLLLSLEQGSYSIHTLKDAFKETLDKRNSSRLIKSYSEVIKEIKNNSQMNKFWNNYQKNYPYSQGIEFNKICEKIEIVLIEICR